MQVANLITTRSNLYVPKLGYGLTFSWEMFIPNLSGNDKWNNGFNILKPLITMNDSPQISYHPKKNYLSIILKYRDNPFRAQFAEIKFDKIKQQSIKDELKELTYNAFEKEVFGAPTFIVNNKIFWGQDRLEYALEELS